MRLMWLGAVLLLAGLCLEATPAVADVLPGGKRWKSRRSTAPKEYIQNNNLKNPSLTVLMISRFKKRSAPLLTKQWEELTR